MLKSEEFPELAAIMEYTFGESDHFERAGSGLESHPRLTDAILYCAAVSNTMMKDARKQFWLWYWVNSILVFFLVLITPKITKKALTKQRVITLEEE